MNYYEIRREFENWLVGLGFVVKNAIDKQSGTIEKSSDYEGGLFLMVRGFSMTPAEIDTTGFHNENASITILLQSSDEIDQETREVLATKEQLIAEGYDKLMANRLGALNLPCVINCELVQSGINFQSESGNICQGFVEFSLRRDIALERN